MDGGLLDQHVQYGYAKCAQKVGSNFNVFRPTSPINPLASGNNIGVGLGSANQSWDYMKANRYGNAVWNFIVNNQFANAMNPVPILRAQVNDYFVGIADEFDDVDDNSTYFIMAMQFLMPPQAVKCNDVLTLLRPTQGVGAGYQGYAGYTPATSEIIMQNIPASVLGKGRGEKSPVNLPTDSKEPTWIVLLPNIDGTVIRIGDIFLNSINEDFVVTENELTELGWRLQATQVVNSR
jgi:hypothetical protein